MTDLEKEKEKGIFTITYVSPELRKAINSIKRGEYPKQDYKNKTKKVK